jgi:formylglycine-generating enzyme required for sulfatase activity
MAWGRLALIHAAGESDDILKKMAELWGYQPVEQDVKLSLKKDSENLPENQNDTGKENQENAEHPARPPALFIVVNQLKTKPDISPEPDSFSGTPPELTLEGSYRFKAAKPLLTMARLIPLLHNGLGQNRKGNNIDMARLSSQLAQGKALKRLPYLPRLVWSQRVQIIVDARLDLEPYWVDFEFIVDELKKRLGKEAVSAIRFDEDSMTHEQAYCLSYPARSHDSWQLWQEPADDVAVLILSDVDAKHWRYLIKRLQPRTAPILTLSPSRNAPNDVSLCQLLKPNPLNDSQPVRRHPYQKGFKLPELLESKRCEIFALLAALPLIDAALLRRLRKELNWGGSELEHFIWRHPDVADNGLGIYFPNETAENYRQDYPNETEQFWQIVDDHHATAFQGLTCLEGLNHAIQANKPLADNIKRYYQYLATRLNTEQTNSALSTQAQTVIALTPNPNGILNTEISNLLHRIAAMSYTEEQWQQLLNQGYNQYQLEASKPIAEQKTKQQDWHIVQQGQGQFSCLQSDNSPKISIAKLSAILPPVQIKADGKQQIISSEQRFNLAENETLTIKTEAQQLQLKAITKPSWALSIGRDQKGLFVTVPWLDEPSLYWEKPTQEQAGQWNGHNGVLGIDEKGLYISNREGLGVDEYGLYADLVIKNITQRFRWIEPSTFLMGSPETEAGRDINEILHQVTINKGFWLADTTVTQALWQAVMGNNPSDFKDDPNNPVENVSWNDAQQFINRLNNLLPDLQAKLPTEAQWEYACRAGTTTPFSFGDNITPEQVNYHGDYPYADGEKGLYREKTVPVKSLPANAWGLYEMHGNVWEWCQDWYGDYPNEPVTNPTGVNEGSVRVRRGGSWSDLGRSARSAYRNGRYADLRNLNLGFRFALGLQARSGQAQASGTDLGSRVAEQRQHKAEQEARPQNKPREKKK